MPNFFREEAARSYVVLRRHGAVSEGPWKPFRSGVTS